MDTRGCFDAEKGRNYAFLIQKMAKTIKKASSTQKLQNENQKTK